MKTKKYFQTAILPLLSLLGLITVIILAAALPNTSLFQGNLSLRPAAGQCATLTLKSIPSPLRSNQSALILIETMPADWQGTFHASASGGLISDSNGNGASVLESDEKVLSYGGGEADASITVQAEGEGNEQCVGVVEVLGKDEVACQNLKIVTSPSPLTANQSAEITLDVTPSDFDGTFLVQTESGRFQLGSADPNSDGENTNIVITSARKLIFSGGKEGETITAKAIGENNTACKETLAISSK